MTGVLVNKQPCEDTETQEGHMMTEAKIIVMLPQSRNRVIRN